VAALSTNGPSPKNKVNNAMSENFSPLTRRQFIASAAGFAATALLGEFSAQSIQPAMAATAMKPLPRGLARIISFAARCKNFDVAQFKKQYGWVVALAAYEDWALLEPSPGVYDFSYLDYLVNVLSPAVNRPIIFIIRTGDPSKGHTPAWIFNTYHRPIIDTNVPDNPGSSIVPWDSVINQRYTQVVSQIAGRYDGHDALAGIYLSGVQAHYPEMLFPRSPLWDDAKVMAPCETFDVRPDGGVYSQAWQTMLDWMLISDRGNFHNTFQRTWVINMLDDVQSPQNGATVSGPRQTVAASINQSYASRATAGTANLGYDTVVSHTPAQKYVDLSSHNMHCPIVYELGPNKQTLGPGQPPNQVYSAINVGVKQLGCHLIMTLPTTWASDTWVQEMQSASKLF